MRYSYGPLIAVILLQSGCSSMIAVSGVDLAALKTQEEVRAKFGDPIDNGIGKDESFDTFRSRSKYRDPMGVSSDLMAFGMTLGLSELVMVPAELYKLARATLFGQDVRFTYNAAGQVTEVSVDGKWVGGTAIYDSCRMYREHFEHLAAELQQKRAESPNDR
jgi:hypothetical protein